MRHFTIYITWDVLRNTYPGIRFEGSACESRKWISVGQAVISKYCNCQFFGHTIMNVHRAWSTR